MLAFLEENGAEHASIPLRRGSCRLHGIRMKYGG